MATYSSLTNHSQPFSRLGFFYTRRTADVKTSSQILHSTCCSRAEHFSLVCFSHPPTLIKVCHLMFYICRLVFSYYLFCSVTRVGAWPTHLIITRVSSPSPRDVQYIVTSSCTVVVHVFRTSSHGVQYIITWCISGKSQTPPPHIMYLAHVTHGMAPGVLWFWGCTDGVPHSGCSRTVWTLQTPWSHLFVWCFVNWINISSPNPNHLLPFLSPR